MSYSCSWQPQSDSCLQVVRVPQAVLEDTTWVSLLSWGWTPPRLFPDCAALQVTNFYHNIAESLPRCCTDPPAPHLSQPTSSPTAAAQRSFYLKTCLYLGHCAAAWGNASSRAQPVHFFLAPLQHQAYLPQDLNWTQWAPFMATYLPCFTSAPALHYAHPSLADKVQPARSGVLALLLRLSTGTACTWQTSCSPTEALSLHASPQRWPCSMQTQPWQTR